MRELVQLPPEGRLRALSSRASGLSEGEALARLREFGPNEPATVSQRPLLLQFAGNFTHTLALLLWFAAGLAFAARIWELALAIAAVVVVNGVFAFIQEYRASRVMEALMRRVSVHARVVREGRLRTIPAAGLVPGDIVQIARGDVAPADLVLLDAENLSLDLSTVTGESAPVERAAGPVQPGTRHAYDLAPYVPSSAVVATGSATALVVATGAASAMGQIAHMVETAEEEPSVLQQEVESLAHFTAVAAVLAGVVTLAVAGASGDVSFVVALTFATGAIVALVPEGLLPTLSISLAIGAQRMAERGAAIRQLSAVESVGAVTVICTDKTGTLTENVLTVAGVLPGADGQGEPDLAVMAALAIDVRRGDAGWIGDPIDVALAKWVEGRGLDPVWLQTRGACRPGIAFEAHRRFMTVIATYDGRDIEIAKGAPEAVLGFTGLSLPAEVQDAVDEAAGRGERLLMFAVRDSGWRVAGTMRLEDPVRPEAPAAIEACHNAGIRIAMLTGDHPATALAVARAVGIRAATAWSGSQLDEMDDAEVTSLLQSDAVIARIDPAQKLRIAELLQRAGEIVVVTGDGINDAPALRAADVGVAMGLRGTEVAKQAADIVLADDNFATIVEAIRQGRAIKENIRRFASYVFTSNVAEVVPFILYVFLPIPLPLAVIQVLAIDLGTDLLPALALGAEPPAARLMAAPPEPPSRPLLTRHLVLKTFLFFGLIEAMLGVSGYFALYAAEGWRPFDSLDPFAASASEARALTFIGIVSGQIGCVIAQRDGPLFARLDPRTNPLVALGVATEVVAVIVLVFVPGVNGLFQMAAPPVPWLLVLPAGAVLFVTLDAVRRAVAAAAGGARRPG